MGRSGPQLSLGRGCALKPCLKEQWCIRPEADTDFVWCMEDVLAISTRRYDPCRPQVCLDEISEQVLAEARVPLPVTPWRPARHVPGYVRAGVVNLFIVREPLRGWRRVRVSAQLTRTDSVRCVMESIDIHYPPAEAKRIASKLEIHATPKHGSWLNMAEIEADCAAAAGPGRAPGRRGTHRTRGGGLNGRTTPLWPASTWRFTAADAHQAQAPLPRKSPVTHH
jgi:hypothetical protein